MRHTVFGLASFCAFLGLCDTAAAQVCRPVSERARVGDVGCWIIAAGSMGQIAEPQVFWHLDTYPTRADADAAKGPRGTVVESYGKVWLLTIEAKGWRPLGGERVNEIGPLPVVAGRGYSVQYMEATFDPGMTAPSHEHPDPKPGTRWQEKPVSKRRMENSSDARAARQLLFPAARRCI